MQEVYLSIREVSERLRVDYQVIRLLVSSGQLKATRVGKQWRITESDLKAYLNINKNDQGAGR